MPPPNAPDSRPGDLVGRDDSGRVRIDRVLPLPWVIGMMVGIGLQAATLYYGQQQVAEKVLELRSDVRALNNATQTAATRDVEHSMRIQSLERRVDVIETARHPGR